MVAPLVPIMRLKVVSSIARPMRIRARPEASMIASMVGKQLIPSAMRAFVRQWEILLGLVFPFPSYTFKSARFSPNLEQRLQRNKHTRRLHPKSISPRIPIRLPILPRPKIIHLICPPPRKIRPGPSRIIYKPCIRIFWACHTPVCPRGF
jgi:hypothetical protein